MQRPSTSKPAARPKGGLPDCLCGAIRHQNVREIDIALSSALVPVKHGVDRLREFRVARFFDAARIDPKVLMPVLSCLSGAELDLGTTRFLRLPLASSYVLEENLAIGIFAPSMRQDRVWRDGLSTEVRQDQLIVLEVEKAHCCNISSWHGAILEEADTSAAGALNAASAAVDPKHPGHRYIHLCHEWLCWQCPRAVQWRPLARLSRTVT